MLKVKLLTDKLEALGFGINEDKKLMIVLDG